MEVIRIVSTDTYRTRAEIAVSDGKSSKTYHVRLEQDGEYHWRDYERDRETGVPTGLRNHKSFKLEIQPLRAPELRAAMAPHRYNKRPRQANRR